MEYIVSRPYLLPTDADELAQQLWYSLWQKKLWPYKELAVGDILYWYETKSKQIVWRSKVIEVNRSRYTSKEMLPELLGLDRNHPDVAETYTTGKLESGYFLAWKVFPMEKLAWPKPSDLRFPLGGWLRVDEAVAHESLRLHNA
jgi:hypothetical protein